MNPIAFAPRRPLRVTVGVVAFCRIPVDVFPNLKFPVVYAGEHERFIGEGSHVAEAIFRERPFNLSSKGNET